jgi:hypothetical protein
MKDRLTLRERAQLGNQSVPSYLLSKTFFWIALAVIFAAVGYAVLGLAGGY